MDLCQSDVNVNPERGCDDISSAMAIVGMAGDVAEVAELPQSEQGRIALLKVTHDRANSDWNFRIRARLSTCRVDEKSYGKPGVSICRFRPGDGRLFAVGGWDHRVRLFERSKGTAMAILRGHTGSVNALDWAPDAISSGLLASTGGEDNQIHLWQCFAKS
jgi:WD40 repeat protein